MSKAFESFQKLKTGIKPVGSYTGNEEFKAQIRAQVQKAFTLIKLSFDLPTK